MFKLVAIDLDGTLLNSVGEISSENLCEIRRIHEIGLKVAIATGRVPQVISWIPGVLGFHPILICANGAVLIMPERNEPILDRCIDRGVSLEILSYLSKAPYYHYIYTRRGELIRDARGDTSLHVSVVERPGQGRSLSDFRETGNRSSSGVIGVSTRYSTNIAQLVKTENVDVRKIVVAARGDEQSLLLPEFRRRWLGRVSMWSSGPTAIEIVERGCSKGLALLHALEILGITPEEVLAIGDAENDLDMLRVVGWPVAMGNADPKVTEVCKFVTANNDDHGVALAISRLIPAGTENGPPIGCVPAKTW